MNYRANADIQADWRNLYCVMLLGDCWTKRSMYEYKIRSCF